MLIDPVAFRERYPLPPSLAQLIAGNDMMNDGAALYAAAKHAQPKLIVELGTREGVSTRILAAVGAEVITIDVVDCTRFLSDVPCTFIHKPAEEVYLTWERPIDLLFIDTDPHSEEQTRGWLDTWVIEKLAPTGCALFHDSITSGVGAATRAWIIEHPTWSAQELSNNNGMCLLLPPMSTFENLNGI